MREIKFRAWTKMGFIYKSLPSHGYMSPPEVGSHQPICWQQYTGLKDKNGVEIYEGDIVDDHYFESYVSRNKVYWADNYGCWSTLGLKYQDRQQLAYFHEAKKLHRNEYLEVIGNIYENPELLDEANN